MGKKAVKPKHISRRKEAKPNLFEHIYNKKKFNVLGKKQKGEQKHGKARADAVDKVYTVFLGCHPGTHNLCALWGSNPLRVHLTSFLDTQRKKTLLVEYKELQKSNAFVDRRFGGVVSQFALQTVRMR